MPLAERDPHPPHDGISFYAGSRIALLTAAPYIQECASRGVPVCLFVPEKLAAGLPPVAGVRHVRSTEELVGPRWAWLLHGALLVLLMRERPARDARFHRGVPLTRVPRVVRAVRRVLPKPLTRHANAIVDRLVGSVQPNRFCTRDVVVVSNAQHPYLLCSRGLRSITLLESWDHPAKRPAGYRTDLLVAWNADLASDWLRFQGAGRVTLGYPVKLQGAVQHAASWARQAHTSRRRRRLMYSATTSSNSEASLPGVFEEERRLVQVLAAAARDQGWELLIKPKPNGRPGDYDFAAGDDHVLVGHSGSSPDPNDYTLDDTYNQKRFAELRSCDAVLSCATTFALDAALAGAPVVQVDLRASSDWPRLGATQESYHLRKYLLSNPDVVRLEPEESLYDAVVHALRGPLDPAYRFRDSLRRWVASPRPMKEAVARAVDAMLETPRGDDGERPLSR